MHERVDVPELEFDRGAYVVEANDPRVVGDDLDAALDAAPMVIRHLEHEEVFEDVPVHVTPLSLVDSPRCPNIVSAGPQPAGRDTGTEPQKFIRSLSTTSGRFRTCVCVAPMYSPRIPRKNIWTDDRKNSPITSGAIPTENVFQFSSL